MKKFISYIGALALVVSVYGLFELKQHVQDLRSQLREVNKQLQQEQDSMYILQAELAYLKSPQRIAALSKKYLELEPIKVSQLSASFSGELSKEIKKYHNVKFIAKKSNKTLVSWRYKKTPSQYIMQVSSQR